MPEQDQNPEPSLDVKLVATAKTGGRTRTCLASGAGIGSGLQGGTATDPKRS